MEVAPASGYAFASPCLAVDRVDARRHDSDQDLGRDGRRPLHLDRLQHFGAPKTRHLDGAHAQMVDKKTFFSSV